MICFIIGWIILGLLGVTVIEDIADKDTRTIYNFILYIFIILFGFFGLMIAMALSDIYYE